MSKKYDIELTVNSVIDNLDDCGFADSDPEINIFTTDGHLRVTDMGYDIFYVEESEGGKTYCTLSALKDGGAYLKRHGACEFEVPFREGERVEAVYKISPYAFDVTVDPLKIRNSLTESGGEIALFYSMNIGGQSKKVKLKISVKVK